MIVYKEQGFLQKLFNLIKGILGKNYIYHQDNARGNDNSEVLYLPADAKSIGNSNTALGYARNMTMYATTGRLYYETN